MDLPNWNLKEFYPSYTSNLINKDIKILKKKTGEFSLKFKGKLNFKKTSFKL